MARRKVSLTVQQELRREGDAARSTREIIRCEIKQRQRPRAGRVSHVKNAGGNDRGRNKSGARQCPQIKQTAATGRGRVPDGPTAIVTCHPRKQTVFNRGPAGYVIREALCA